MPDIYVNDLLEMEPDYFDYMLKNIVQLDGCDSISTVSDISLVERVWDPNLILTLGMQSYTLMRSCCYKGNSFTRERIIA